MGIWDCWSKVENGFVIVDRWRKFEINFKVSSYWVLLSVIVNLGIESLDNWYIFYSFGYIIKFLFWYFCFLVKYSLNLGMLYIVNIRGELYI